MTAVSLVYDAVFVSGKCPAVTGVRRRARTLPAPAGKDYCLLDERGRRLGTIPAALVRPAVGRSAPTLLLHREWGA
jgi:hypothetical protein